MTNIFVLIYNKSLSNLVNKIAEFLEGMGRFIYFLKEILFKMVQYSPNYSEVFFQIYYIGIKSIIVVSITGLFVGALVSMNLYSQLVLFGAESFLGGLNVSSSLREFTPLLISSIIASRVGVFTTAELGAMRISDEIDALRSLSVDPIRYLLVPRFLGVLISTFSLLLFGLFMSFLGGLFAAMNLGINPVQYMITVPFLVSASSLVYALVKCFIFGFIVASIGCFMGYNASGGSKGLARTTRLAAEFLIVSLIFVDYILAMFINFISGLL